VHRWCRCEITPCWKDVAKCARGARKVR